MLHCIEKAHLLSLAGSTTAVSTVLAGTIVVSIVLAGAVAEVSASTPVSLDPCDSAKLIIRKHGRESNRKVKRKIDMIEILTVVVTSVMTTFSVLKGESTMVSTLPSSFPFTGEINRSLRLEVLGQGDFLFRSKKTEHVLPRWTQKIPNRNKTNNGLTLLETGKHSCFS
jgi:hypothetical protein